MELIVLLVNASKANEQNVSVGKKGITSPINADFCFFNIASSCFFQPFLLD